MSKYIKNLFDLLCEEIKKSGLNYNDIRIDVVKRYVKNNLMVLINKIVIKEVKNIDRFKSKNLISYDRNFYELYNLRLFKDRWYVCIKDHEIFYYDSKNSSSPIRDFLKKEEIKEIFESLDSRGIIKIVERKNDKRYDGERLFLDLSVDKIKVLMTYTKLIKGSKIKL